MATPEFPGHQAAHPLPAGADRRTHPGKQRAGKLLESAAIKLSSVVSDLHGVTGRDITDHPIAGERDPKALAQLARARRKIARHVGKLGALGFEVTLCRRPDPDRSDTTQAA